MVNQERASGVRARTGPDSLLQYEEQRLHSQQWQQRQRQDDDYGGDDFNGGPHDVWNQREDALCGVGVVSCSKPFGIAKSPKTTSNLMFQIVVQET